MISPVARWVLIVVLNAVFYEYTVVQVRRRGGLQLTPDEPPGVLAGKVGGIGWMIGVVLATTGPAFVFALAAGTILPPTTRIAATFVGILLGSVASAIAAARVKRPFWTTVRSPNRAFRLDGVQVVRAASEGLAIVAACVLLLQTVIN